jgi:gamma-glutamylcyclotransferase (GGCT)/AIG2-like uncharacterized protein YtfP
MKTIVESPMIDRLFSYGTLQVPEVMQAVTGRTYEGLLADLPGYAVYTVNQAEYPGVVPQAGSKAPGTLYIGVAPQQLKALDVFEGDLYERRLLEVVTSDGHKSAAWVYVVPARLGSRLSSRPWSLRHFVTHDFQKFWGGYVRKRQAEANQSAQPNSEPGQD